ncbi:MAG: hypothetical protein K9H61_07065, partial [Bacteroidia bacterium]|nr:hypothetical protein [Bacteroidia bacterium]
AAVMAPSGGNVQPWRILFHKGNLILVHDIYHSQAFLDYAHLGSYLAFGTMVENIRIQSLALGYKINCQYFPEPKDTRIVASIWFEPNPTKIVDGRVNAIYDRLTNRRIGNREPLPIAVKEGISRITQAEKLAKLTLVEDLDKMNALADILSTAEKLLLLHPQGHHDIFHKELRFSKEEALATADGLDIATLNMSKAEILALRIASSRKAIDWVDKIGGGEAFKKNTKKAIAASSALGIITMPFFSNEAYLHGGEFLEKIWIETTLGKCSFQPVTQYSYLLARLNHGNGIGYDEAYKEKIRALSYRFNEILHEVSDREVIFIFRLALENEPEVRSIRRSVDKIFIE